MIDSVVDVMGFLLLCVGSKMANPRLLRMLCSVAATYIGVFSVCSYIWLIPQFRAFKAHPEFIYTGISAAFRFEHFWKLLGNLIFLEAMLPVAAIFLLYFGIKWLAGSTKPGSSYY